MRQPDKTWLDRAVELAAPWLFLFGFATLFSRIFPAVFR
jgi:hypothetical protein